MDKQKFIEEIGKAAKECYKVYNILPSLVIAMACKESAFGNSQLASKHFNYFGMKWNTKCGTKYVEYNTKEWDKKTGKYITVKAKFRSYDSIAEGIKGFYDFLGYKRYANLIGEKDPAIACQKIQADGWATAPDYAVSLFTDYIQRYNLTVYDSDAPIVQPVKESYVKGKVYTTTVNLYIRTSPAGTKRKMYEITPNAKVNSYMDQYGDAVLKAGTRVTCMDVVKDGSNIWIRIPSGYICANYHGKIYVE